MASAEERLMEWLRDAHAAEEQAETMLSGMARRIENYPDLRARIEQHIGETQRQATVNLSNARDARRIAERTECRFPGGCEASSA
jgi:ferritin-like metal-binding protein YciE